MERLQQLRVLKNAPELGLSRNSFQLHLIEDVLLRELLGQKENSPDQRAFLSDIELLDQPQHLFMIVFVCQLNNVCKCCQVHGSRKPGHAAVMFFEECQNYQLDLVDRLHNFIRVALVRHQGTLNYALPALNGLGEELVSAGSLALVEGVQTQE